MEYTGFEADDLSCQITFLQKKKEECPVGSKERSEREKAIVLYCRLLREIKENNFCLVIN